MEGAPDLPGQRAHGDRVDAAGGWAPSPRHVLVKKDDVVRFDRRGHRRELPSDTEADRPGEALDEVLPEGEATVVIRVRGY